MPNKINRVHTSSFHGLIERSNTVTLVAVGVAVFIFIFCVFATRALVSQSLYQGRVINEKKEALSQLEENKQAADALRSTYVAFATETQNILGGDPASDDAKGGDNPRLVLDALPSENDYPALSSSIEKILEDGGYAIKSIGGSDAAFVGTSTVALGSSSPVAIDYPVSVDAEPQRALELLQTFERSIRPFAVTDLSISSLGPVLSMNMTLETYFQAPVTMEVTSKEVQ